MAHDERLELRAERRREVVLRRVGYGRLKALDVGVEPLAVPLLDEPREPGHAPHRPELLRRDVGIDGARLLQELGFVGCRERESGDRDHQRCNADRPHHGPSSTNHSPFRETK